MPIEGGIDHAIAKAHHRLELLQRRRQALVQQSRRLAHLGGSPSSSDQNA